MKHALISAVLIGVCSGIGMCQEPVRIKTENGREIILNADGTWKYASETLPKTAKGVGFNRAAGATKVLKSDRGAFSVWYDETKWHLDSRSPEPGIRSFSLRRGDGYGYLIAEEIELPLLSLKKIALENAREFAPDAKIVFEETRTVNGKEVLCMKIEGTIEEVPFRYLGYYYAGKQGTVQFLTFTSQRLFEKYESDFVSFLNGLEIE